MSISNEDDIPDDVLVEDLSEPEEGAQLIHNNLANEFQDSTSAISHHSFDDNFNNNLSDDENEDWIESVASGFFIQDTMMYKPFQMIPPSPYRHSYVCRLDTWLYGQLSPNVWNESLKRFVMRCLQDLRNWNDDANTSDRVVDEGSELEEIFETWPERIRRFEENLQHEVEGRYDSITFIRKKNSHLILSNS